MILKVVDVIPLITASESDVEAFLSDARAAIEDGEYIFDKSQKNIETLKRLGKTLEEALDEICNLDIGDIFSGPEVHDRNPNLDKVWMFKKNVFYQTIYIKLQVLYQHDKRLVVMSFHIDGM